MTLFNESPSAHVLLARVQYPSLKQDTPLRRKTDRGVEPGDFATVRAAQIPSPDATPSPWVCCDKRNIRPGSEL